MAWSGEVEADLPGVTPAAYRVAAEASTEGLGGEHGRGVRGGRPGVLDTTWHARFNRPYTELTYRPMVDLVHYLQGAAFEVYLTSAAGRDFMRAVCEEIYDIPRAMAIGSSVTFEYAEDAQGVAQVVRTREIEQRSTTGPASRDIHRAIGAGRSWRRATPTATSTCSSTPPATGLKLSLLVHHDDAEREYAYDGEGRGGAATGRPKRAGSRQHEVRLEDDLRVSTAPERAAGIA